MNNKIKPEFNKFQSIFWPIHNFELKKFLPMSFLMFFLLMTYRMIGDLKTIFINKKTNLWIGANATASTNLISALKFWFVLPATFLAVMLFTALINKHGPKKTFYIMISIFMTFYAIFGFVIYPHIDIFLMSSETITEWQSSVPNIFHSVIACIGNWPYTLFYIISDIWGVMAIASLFWQFANEVTMKNEVKRFFALFSIIGDIGVIFSGLTLKKMTSVNENFNQNVIILMLGVVICCLISMGIYFFIDKKVLTDQRLYVPSEVNPKKKKEKVKLTEGIVMLFKTPYLLLTFVLIIGVTFAQNFTEIMWDTQLVEFFPEATQYGSMKANLSIIVGIVTIVMVLLSANVLRRCKWRTSALLTPFIYLVLGGLFFGLILYRYLVSPVIGGVQVIQLTSWIGLFLVGIVRSAKYSLADTTRNMAYIPLDESYRTKGQAAVENIGGRAGKASSSAIQQVLVSGGKALTNYIPLITGIFVVAVFGWIAATFKLNPKYLQKLKEREEEDKLKATLERDEQNG